MFSWSTKSVTMATRHLLALCLLSGTVTLVYSRSVQGDQEPDWHLNSIHREDWIRCHGYRGEECNRMLAKLKELESEIKRKYSFSADAVHLQNFSLTEPPGEAEEVIFLTVEQLEYFISSQSRRKRRKIDTFVGYSEQWDLPIHYQFDGTHNSAERDLIHAAIHHWEAQTCIRFVELPEHDAYTEPHILFVKAMGCGSYIGRVYVNPQPVMLGAACFYQFGTLAHELGHVIGYWHEHQRSDRGDHITVIPGNAVMGSLFVSEFVRTGSTVNMVPYDYSSVLHYNSRTLSANGEPTILTSEPLYQQTIGQRTGLSFLDVKLANQVYCSATCQHGLSRHCERGGYQDPNACWKCKCPDGFGGDFCHEVAQPKNAQCGGVVDLTPGIRHNIWTPNYFDPLPAYPVHHECNWLLQAPPGYHIVFKFIGAFGFYCRDEACFHWLEVRYKEDLGALGPRFCCLKHPNETLTSESNAMLVLSRANYTAGSWARRGMSAEITAVRASGAPETSPVPTNTDSDCPILDLALIVDSSGSIGRINWPKLIAFLTNFIELFSIGREQTQIGAVSFGSSATLHFDLDDHENTFRVVNAVHEIRWKDEMTNTSGGIRLTRQEVFTPAGGQRAYHPDVAVLITDGESNRDTQWTITEARAAKANGITLFVVGVGQSLNMREIQAIASDPDIDHVFIARDFDSLRDEIAEPLHEKICKMTSQVAVAPPSTTTTSTTTTTTTVPTTTTTTTTTTSPTPGPVSGVPGGADICFVLDSSGSIGELNWPKLLSFVASVVSHFNVDASSHRVAAVSFGSYANVEFPLDEQDTLETLVGKIENIRWRDEMTNISGGIRVMRTQVFRKAGDRSLYRNVGIVITDGASNRDAELTDDEADLARSDGITMVVVGVGNQLNMVEVQAMANDNVANMILTSDFDSLQSKVTPVINRLVTLLGYGETTTTSTTTTTTTTAPTTTTTTTTQRPTTTTSNVPVMTNPDCLSRVADIAFILDSSGSVGEHNWPYMLNFAWSLAQLLDFGPLNYLYGIISYGNLATLHIDFDDYMNLNDLGYAVSRIPYKDQWTNTSGGLHLARTQLFTAGGGNRAQAPDVAIVITDGVSNKDKSLTIPEAERVRAEGIKILGIGVGPDVDWNELHAIVEPPYNDNTFYTETFPDIWRLTDTIVNRICHFSAPSLGPAPPVNTPGTTTSDCGPFDIAFVLDSSGSIGAGNWRKVLNFVKGVVNLLDVGRDSHNVGVVSFGNLAKVNIPLYGYFERSHLFAAIDVIPWKDQWTNTSGGIRVMRSRLLSSSQGNRPYIPDVAIIVTDGKSNIDSHLTAYEAMLAKANGVKLLVVGVTNQVDLAEVNDIASDPDEKSVFLASTFEELEHIEVQLVHTICYGTDYLSDASDMDNMNSHEAPEVSTEVTSFENTTLPDDTGWGPWSECDRPCGGCGIRRRQQLCNDTTDETQSCGSEEISCNERSCVESDICRKYVAMTIYNAPCPECCDGYTRDGDICVFTDEV